MKFLFVATLCLSSLLCYSQVRKLKAFQESYCFNCQPPTASYLWNQINMLVTVDTKTGKIKVYSDPEATYDIVKVYDDSVSASGDKSLIYDVINDDGDKIKLLITFFHSKDIDNFALLSLRYKNLTNVYYRLKLEM